MKYKLISFDLDGTLSLAGKGVSPNIAKRIVSLAKKGYKIVLNSGKNASYLQGVARGMGLDEVIVIGENGCVTFDLLKFKETKFVDRPSILDDIETKVLNHFKDRIWIQPNQVALTIFPNKREEVSEIASFIHPLVEEYLNKVIVYEHIDAVDIAPRGVHKGKALKLVLETYQIQKSEVIGIGDSTNDLRMFDQVGLPIIIGNNIKYDGAIHFHTIEEALNHVEAL